MMDTTKEKKKLVSKEERQKSISELVKSIRMSQKKRETKETMVPRRGRGERKQYRIMIGWQHFRNGKYRVVTKTKGGGTRMLTYAYGEDLSVTTIRNTAIDFFFPGGINNEGRLQEHDVFLVTSSGQLLENFLNRENEPCTFSDYLKSNGLFASQAHFYLRSKLKEQTVFSVNGKAVTESISLKYSKAKESLYSGQVSEIKCYSHKSCAEVSGFTENREYDAFHDGFLVTEIAKGNKVYLEKGESGYTLTLESSEVGYVVYDPKELHGFESDDFNSLVLCVVTLNHNDNFLYYWWKDGEILCNGLNRCMFRVSEAGEYHVTIADPKDSEPIAITSKVIVSKHMKHISQTDTVASDVDADKFPSISQSDTIQGVLPTNSLTAISHTFPDGTGTGSLPIIPYTHTDSGFQHTSSFLVASNLNPCISQPDMCEATSDSNVALSQPESSPTVIITKSCSPNSLMGTVTALSSPLSYSLSQSQIPCKPCDHFASMDTCSNSLSQSRTIETSPIDNSHSHTVSCTHTESVIVARQSQKNQSLSNPKAFTSPERPGFCTTVTPLEQRVRNKGLSVSNKGETLQNDSLQTSCCPSGNKHIKLMSFDGQTKSSASASVVCVPKIEISDVKMGKEIGRGGFGVVYEGCWLGTKVAVKDIMIKRMKVAKPVIDRELCVHSQLRHPNIVLLMAYAIENNRLYLISELVNGCTLDCCLFNEGVDDMDKPVKLNVSLNIAQAIAYLHAQKPVVIHRDIKPENVLIGKHFRVVKLCDMGLSKLKTMTTVMTTMSGGSIQPGTPAYQAPEVLLDRMSANTMTDIWSLSCTLVEVMVEMPIWNNADDPVHYILNQMKVNKSPDAVDLLVYTEDTDKMIYNILVKGLSYNPVDRPDAHEIVDVFQRLVSNNKELL